MCLVIFQHCCIQFFFLLRERGMNEVVEKYWIIGYISISSMDCLVFQVFRLCLRDLRCQCDLSDPSTLTPFPTSKTSILYTKTI